MDTTEDKTESLENDIDLVAFKRKVEEAEENRRSTLFLGASTTFIVSTVGLIIFIIQLAFIPPLKLKRTDIPTFKDYEVRNQLQAVNLSLKKVSEQVKILSAPSQEISVSLEQKRLSASIERIDQRLKQLEAIIIENPDRAIAIPLLKKDLAESTKRMEEYRSSNRADFDRLYEQQRWMLGGMGTVLLAIIGGAVTIIFKSLKIGKED